MENQMFSIPSTQRPVRFIRTKSETPPITSDLFYYCDKSFNENLERILFKIDAVDSCKEAILLAKRTTLIAKIG